MKITKAQLKQIIKEELSSLSEGRRRGGGFSIASAARHSHHGSDPQHADQMAERETKEQEVEEIRNVLGSGYEVNVRMLEGRYQIVVYKNKDYQDTGHMGDTQAIGE